MKRIERKSSIESEPRTLSFEQIQYAREAALYVVNTRSFEEALRIFTEGLKPVVTGVKKGRVVMDSDEELEFPSVDRSGLSLICTTVLRDVVSAPF